METAVVELACREFPEEYMWKLQQCLKEQELYLRRRDVNGFFASDNQTHSILYQGCPSLVRKPGIIVWYDFLRGADAVCRCCGPC